MRVVIQVLYSSGDLGGPGDGDESESVQGEMKERQEQSTVSRETGAPTRKFERGSDAHRTP